MFRSVEQQNFANIIAAHIRQRDGPLLLEGGVGLGKTRAYLSAVMGAARDGKRIALALPTHALIDQLLASSDLAVTAQGVTVAAFRPARFYEARADYQAARSAAMAAQVMLCTAAAIVIDNRNGGDYNGATARDYLLFDEADQLPSAAAMQVDMEIPAQVFSAFQIKVESAGQAARELLTRKLAEPEHKAAAKLALEILAEPAWYQSAGVTEDGGVAVYHQMPGLLLKRVANQGHVAFVSATLTLGASFADFKRALGIANESPLSSMIEPAVHGGLRFEVNDTFEVDTPEWMTAVLQAIAGAARPVLVVTPSHELALEIGAAVPGAHVRRDDEATADAAMRTGAAGVLVAAGAWAGLDTPVRWASVVVPKVPFPKPTILDGKTESTYLSARGVAIRRLRQVFGRGLRTPDAACTIYLCDPRVRKLGGIVPARFAQQWEERVFAEGARDEVVLSKAERHPALRQAALRKYGCKCAACGFVPQASQQIDIHHLDPIAEGERQTTLADVIPLCANCHRLAHSVAPPMALEVLRRVMVDG